VGSHIQAWFASAKQWKDPGGYALVFDWSDSVSLGRQYEQRARLDGLSVEKRARATQQILDFHVEVAARGWVAIDLYEGSILIDPDSGVVTLCDLWILGSVGPVSRDEGERRSIDNRLTDRLRHSQKAEYPGPPRRSNSGAGDRRLISA
jgi:hypothetical protein